MITTPSDAEIMEISDIDIVSDIDIIDTPIALADVSLSDLTNCVLIPAVWGDDDITIICPENSYQYITTAGGILINVGSSSLSLPVVYGDVLDVSNSTVYTLTLPAYASSGWASGIYSYGYPSYITTRSGRSSSTAYGLVSCDLDNVSIQPHYAGRLYNLALIIILILGGLFICCRRNFRL